jgi:hypothetical protein
MKGQWIAATTVVLLALAPTASAQQPCSQQTVAGTYAVVASGFSAVGSLEGLGEGIYYALHGGSGVFVGPVTIAADGTATGTWWGVYVAFPIPDFPFIGHVTINPDCSGEYTDPDGTNKLVVLDQGKEIRAIRWQGFGNSVTTWYRITRAGEVAPRCSLQTLRGTYMQRCHGFSLGESGVATYNMLSLWTAKEGLLAGTYKGKMFGFPDTLTESATSGTYTVDGDCTVNIAYSFAEMGDITIKAKGVLFDQGQRGIGLPMGIYNGDTMVAPMAPLTCELTRIGS